MGDNRAEKQPIIFPGENTVTFYYYPICRSSSAGDHGAPGEADGEKKTFPPLQAGGRRFGLLKLVLEAHRYSANSSTVEEGTSVMKHLVVCGNNEQCRGRREDGWQGGRRKTRHRK